MTPEEKLKTLRQLCHNARPDCKGHEDNLGCDGCRSSKVITDIWNAGEAAERERWVDAIRELGGRIHHGLSLYENLFEFRKGT